MSLASVIAVNWQWELRGILVTLIGVAVLMGSIYLLLATNLGARLGFLVALCGLAGWMALMGAIWAIYGIGLQGPLGTWEAVPGRTVLQDTSRPQPGRRDRRACRGARRDVVRRRGGRRRQTARRGGRMERPRPVVAVRRAGRRISR